MRGLGFGAAFLVGGTFLGGGAYAQCPAVGLDSGCGVVITVASASATVTPTGQPPYDGSDDSLIGVVNNIPACTAGNSQTLCGLAIFSIDLASAAKIFAFDDDGLVTFVGVGNTKDSTGYGGPNAYFTNINATQTAGRVNFIKPIPPGGTAYLSLENLQNPNFNGAGVTAINGSPNVFGPTTLVAAVLPASRSVQVNGTATAFATMINAGATAATSCSIVPAIGLPATFHYQTTDPKTNAVTGTPDTPVNIAAGQPQSFVIALTPTAAISPTDVPFNFGCTNTGPAPIVVGLNTLLLSASTTPTPDVVALAATATNDGILHLPGSAGAGAFAVATVNVGAGGAITASTNTGSAKLPLTLNICQSNPANGQCLAAPAPTTTTTINANATPTFSIFAIANGAIPFDPANSRIFVTFSDATNAVRGSTSVAVQTQ